MKRMTIAGQHGSLQYTYKTSAAGWKSVIISIAFNHDDDYDLYGIKWILGWRMITSTNIDQGYHSFLEVVLMRDTVWNHLDLKDPSTSWQLCLYLSYLQFREPSSTQSVTHSVRENKLAKARKTRTSPGTLGLQKCLGWISFGSKSFRKNTFKKYTFKKYTFRKYTFV